MSILDKILSSHVRSEIFRLLFNERRPDIHLRDIVRKTELAVGTVQQELKNLKEIDLIVSRKDGNRLYYSANDKHPLYEVICALVSKTCGITEQIREIIQDIKGIDAAFIFGSFAAGKEKSHSDIDLIIIGDVGLRSISPKLKTVTEKIEREINPHVYSMKTWKEKLKKNDHFIRSILETDKIMLIGDEDVVS